MKRTTRMLMVLLVPVLLVGATLASLPGFADTPEYKTAVADIRDGAGQTVGEATFSSTPLGQVRIQVKVRDFNATAGEHGILIHTVGSCVPPAFTSAGSH